MIGVGVAVTISSLSLPGFRWAAFLDFMSAITKRIETWILSHYAFAGLDRGADGRPGALWLKAGGSEFREPFFSLTVNRLSQQVQKGTYVRTGADTLFRVAAASQRGLPLSGLIYHVGRCGSTILSNVIRADAQNFVLSEPHLPLNWMLRAPSEFGNPQWREFARASILALGQIAPKTASRFFIKFFNGNTLAIPMVREAFPGVPELFLYRDPVEVVMSLIADPCLPWLWFRSLTGLPQANAVEYPLTELAARVVGRLLAAMLDHLQEDTLLLNYDQIGMSTVELMLSHFKIKNDPAQMDRITSVLRSNAKRPHQFFADDADRKQVEASRAVREAVARFAIEPYLKLEDARAKRGTSVATQPPMPAFGEWPAASELEGEPKVPGRRVPGDAEGADDRALGFLYRWKTLQALILLRDIETGRGESWDLSHLDDQRFHDALRQTVLCDRAGVLEDLLCQIRRSLLDQVVAERELGRSELSVMVSIASQCFNNQYAFAVDPDEERGLSRLRQRPLTIEAVAARAMYAPAWTIDGPFEGWEHPALRELHERQIVANQEEAGLFDSMPSLGRSDDAFTATV